MIQSMTGFGRGEASDENYRVSAEIKSVNHRYLDINVKCPRSLAFLEMFIKNRVKKFASRGKIDVFLSFEDNTKNAANIEYNSNIAKAYLDGIKQIAFEHQIKFRMDAFQLAKFPDVFTYDEQKIDEEKVQIIVSVVMDLLRKTFLESRLREGQELVRDLLEKLDDIESIVKKIDERFPDIIDDYRKRITEKISDLLGESNVNENVIANEMIIYADRMCIDEEMVRLRTHIGALRELLEDENSSAVGRKLDFITQEMNREANTILSKSTDVEIADFGIELKTLIEKIREQVQNIE